MIGAGVFLSAGFMAQDMGPGPILLAWVVGAILALSGARAYAEIARLAEDDRSPVTLSTYRFAAAKLTKFIGGVRVGEASTARLDAALRSMRAAHGATMAKQSKTILRGALQLAVMANVLGANPVRDVQPLQSKNQPKGAVAISADQLPDLLAKPTGVGLLPGPRSRGPHHHADRHRAAALRTARAALGRHRRQGRPSPSAAS